MNQDLRLIILKDLPHVLPTCCLMCCLTCCPIRCCPVCLSSPPTQVQQPDLAGVSHVMVDEIHERGMNEDFLLIILRDLLNHMLSPVLPYTLNHVLPRRPGRRVPCDGGRDTREGNERGLASHHLEGSAASHVVPCAALHAEPRAAPQVQQPDLAGVSHVMVDEIHERGMNEDFLLIILRDLLPRRPDLRLVLMSATINAELFSDYFNKAPMAHIPVKYFNKAPMAHIPVSEWCGGACRPLNRLPCRPDLRLVLMSATINVELFSEYFHKAPMRHIPVNSGGVCLDDLRLVLMSALTFESTQKSTLPSHSFRPHHIDLRDDMRLVLMSALTFESTQKSTLPSHSFRPHHLDLRDDMRLVLMSALTFESTQKSTLPSHSFRPHHLDLRDDMRLVLMRIRRPDLRLVLMSATINAGLSFEIANKAPHGAQPGDSWGFTHPAAAVSRARVGAHAHSRQGPGAAGRRRGVLSCAYLIMPHHLSSFPAARTTSFPPHHLFSSPAAPTTSLAPPPAAPVVSLSPTLLHNSYRGFAHPVQQLFLEHVLERTRIPIRGLILMWTCSQTKETGRKLAGRFSWQDVDVWSHYSALTRTTQESLYNFSSDKLDIDLVASVVEHIWSATLSTPFHPVPPVCTPLHPSPSVAWQDVDIWSHYSAFTRPTQDALANFSSDKLDIDLVASVVEHICSATPLHPSPPLYIPGMAGCGHMDVDIWSTYSACSRPTQDSLANFSAEKLDIDLVASVVEHICRNEAEGAVLVFLTGWDEISKLLEVLKAMPVAGQPSKVLLLPLHGSMPTIQQKDIFNRPPPGVRKVVLATNIAETSITIDDVVFVVDCGKAKETSYDALNKLACLLPSWISKASAHQRRGRAGRVQPGICFHLYPKLVYDSLLEFQLPEILRTPLQELCVQIKHLELGHVQAFLSKAMQPPEALAVQNAVQLLETIGAFTPDEQLTPLGCHLAAIPVEPRIGKMLIFGAIFNCLAPALTIAASLAYRDPFVLPLEKKELADAAKKEFSKDSRSDHITLLNAFEGWRVAKQQGLERRFCWDNFLSAPVLQMVADMRGQFLQLLSDIGFYDPRLGLHEYSKLASDQEMLSAVICAGLYPSVAQIRRQGTRFVLFTKDDGQVKIHPSSVNAFCPSFSRPWLVYNEKVKTSDIFLRDSTMVSDFALLMFGGNFEPAPAGRMGFDMLGGYLHFSASAQTAQLVQDLRQQLDGLLREKIENPSLDVHAQGERVVAAVRSLLSSPHANSVPPEEAGGELDLTEDNGYFILLRHFALLGGLSPPSRSSLDEATPSSCDA
ncbi:unnamed protein product [Closterium sp. Naga37s-1]|nr:unnamed protein product [Closterium sp. Naga37s-1]